MTRMAWTAEDRRKYAPAVQEVLRQGMIVRLVRTMDALDPQPRVGRERVWSTLIMLQALWCLAARRPWHARSRASPWGGRTDRTAGGSRRWRGPDPAAAAP